MATRGSSGGTRGGDAAAIVRTLARLHPLERVPRAGWLLRGVTDPESVAAHSHALALLVRFACDAWPGRFDAERAISLALVHDCAEVATMDIPMPAGDAAFRAAKNRTERAVAASIFGGLAGDATALFEEFEAAATPEARLVRGLDKVQMMIRAACYAREGRGDLEDFWRNPANFEDYGLEPVRALFAEVASLAGRRPPKAPHRAPRRKGTP